MQHYSWMKVIIDVFAQLWTAKIKLLILTARIVNVKIVVKGKGLHKKEDNAIEMKNKLETLLANEL